MMYLLDTNIIIYSLKGMPTIKEQLEKHILDPLSISVITLMELYYGAYKSQRTVSNLAKIKVLENTLEIIPVDLKVVEIFGLIKSKLEIQGIPLDDFDIIIASTALSLNSILVTNNVKHFERIDGLKLENWTETEPGVEPEIDR